jgi:hypothetical protein
LGSRMDNGYNGSNNTSDFKTHAIFVLKSFSQAWITRSTITILVRLGHEAGLVGRIECK